MLDLYQYVYDLGLLIISKDEHISWKWHFIHWLNLYWKDVNKHHEYNDSNNKSELDDVSCFKHKYVHVTSRIHGQCTKWFVLKKSSCIGVYKLYKFHNINQLTFHAQLALNYLNQLFLILVIHTCSWVTIACFKGGGGGVN